MASTLKALSTPTEEANWLNAGIRADIISRELTPRNIFIICEYMKSMPAPAAAATVVLTGAVSAQTLEPAGPEFEVAVVRENQSGEPRGRIELVNARFNAVNMTLRSSSPITYPAPAGGFRHATQLVGGPDWVTSARFDIIAKVEGFQGDTNRPGWMRLGSARRSEQVVARAVSTGILARDLYDWSGRPAVDRTGIQRQCRLHADVVAGRPRDATAPSIFTALQEQLGLKLQPARGPIEVLVVDSATDRRRNRQPAVRRHSY